MLVDTPLIAFVATGDADRARQFYSEVLGLTLVADEPHALVYQAGGTMLRIQKVPPFTPHPFTALGWQVSDLPSTVRALSARGVEFARFPGLEQDADGVWHPDAVTGVAWFRDPDGNLLSLTAFGGADCAEGS